MWKQIKLHEPVQSSKLTRMLIREAHRFKLQGKIQDRDDGGQRIILNTRFGSYAGDISIIHSDNTNPDYINKIDITSDGTRFDKRFQRYTDRIKSVLYDMLSEME